MLKTKSVWEPIDHKNDGLRILVTRFRGRGLPKTRYNLWMASLGPSEKLLRCVSQSDISWPECARLYQQELFEGGSFDNKQ